MQVAAVNDPIAAIRDQYRRRRGVCLSTRLSRVLTDAWRCHQERQLEAALRSVGHEGVWQDYRQASDA